MKKPEVRSRVCLGNRSSIRAFFTSPSARFLPGSWQADSLEKIFRGGWARDFSESDWAKITKIGIFYSGQRFSWGHGSVDEEEGSGGNPGEKEEVPLFQWRGENGSPGEVTRSWAVVDPFSGRGESRNYLEGDSWVPIESSLRLAQSPLSRTASAAPDAIRCTVRWKESLLR